MKYLLQAGLVIGWSTALQAQANTQIIIVGLLTTDRTFDRGEKSFFEVRGSRDQVVYAHDSSRNEFVVKQYVRESHIKIEDRDHSLKEKHKTKTPRFSNHVNGDNIKQFLTALRRSVDSLPVKDYFLHTSHYYLNVYVSVVIDGDTTTWHKSQPFERTTPWHCEKGTFLNPAIDAFVAMLLPKKFIGRDVLAKPRAPEMDPTSLARPAFRVTD